MTTTIAGTSSPTAGIAPLPHDDAADPAPVAHDGAAPAEAAAGERPFGKLGLNDLHQMVQQFAAFTPGHGNGVGTLFAPYPPQANPKGSHGTPGMGIPLYDTQGPGGAQGTQLAAPVKPGVPMDARQMEKLNEIAQKYDLKKSPKDDDLRDGLRQAKAHMQAATVALKAGDYKQAENQLRHLGFPLPRPHSGDKLSREGAFTAILLGVPATARPRGVTTWRL